VENNRLKNRIWEDKFKINKEIILSHKFSNCGARPPPGRVLLVVWGARVFCMKDISILNEIWGQDKMYILVGTLLDRNILLIN
jgi:hypothetical protein